MQIVGLKLVVSAFVTVKLVVIILSHPLAVISVSTYVPPAFTILPSGKV